MEQQGWDVLLRSEGAAVGRVTAGGVRARGVMRAAPRGVGVMCEVWGEGPDSGDQLRARAAYPVSSSDMPKAL